MTTSEIEERLARIERLVIIAGKEVLTTGEVALMLGISEGRVRHLACEKSIPYYKSGRDNYYRKSDIERWMLSGIRVDSNNEIDAKATTYCVLNRAK